MTVKIFKNQLTIQQRCSHQFTVPRTRQQSCLVLYNWNLTFRHEPHHKMNISQLANRSWTRWDYLSGEKKTQHNVFVLSDIQRTITEKKDVTSGVGRVDRSYSSTDFATSSCIYSDRKELISSPYTSLSSSCSVRRAEVTPWQAAQIRSRPSYFWEVRLSGHLDTTNQLLLNTDRCLPIRKLGMGQNPPAKSHVHESFDQ